MKTGGGCQGRIPTPPREKPRIFVGEAAPNSAEHLCDHEKFIPMTTSEQFPAGSFRDARAVELLPNSSCYFTNDSLRATSKALSMMDTDAVAVLVCDFHAHKGHAHPDKLHISGPVGNFRIAGDLRHVNAYTYHADSGSAGLLLKING